MGRSILHLIASLKGLWSTGGPVEAKGGVESPILGTKLGASKTPRTENLLGQHHQWSSSGWCHLTKVRNGQHWKMQRNRPPASWSSAGTNCDRKPENCFGAKMYKPLIHLSWALGCLWMSYAVLNYVNWCLSLMTVPILMLMWLGRGIFTLGCGAVFKCILHANPPGRWLQHFFWIQHICLMSQVWYKFGQ